MEILNRHCDVFGRDPTEIEVTHNTRVVIGETRGGFEALATQGAASANISLGAYKKSLSRAIAGTPRAMHRTTRPVRGQWNPVFFLVISRSYLQ